MAERADFIRERMRQSWGERYHDFAEHAAPETARYAAHLMELVQPATGERVLDVATGPGVVALAAAAEVGTIGSVVATDLVPAWGDVVRERAAAAGFENITFETMGAESLTFADESFDVACCQFGLMFVPDPAQALREMHRVLRPMGRLGLVVWSTPDRVPQFSLEQLLGSLAPPPPDEQLPNQFALAEPGLIERLVTGAGFHDVLSERHTLERTVDDVNVMWDERIRGVAPMTKGSTRVNSVLDQLTDAQRQQLKTRWLDQVAPYRQGDALVLPGEAIYVTAQR